MTQLKIVPRILENEIKKSNYPLYDHLLTEVNKNLDKKIDISKICATINEISHNMDVEATMDHYREIQALIIHHYTLTNGGIIPHHVPYDGKIMLGGKGVLHQIANMPAILQRIIAQYILEAAN